MAQQEDSVLTISGPADDPAMVDLWTYADLDLVFTAVEFYGVEALGTVHTVLQGGWQSSMEVREVYKTMVTYRVIPLTKKLAASGKVDASIAEDPWDSARLASAAVRLWRYAAAGGRVRVRRVLYGEISEDEEKMIEASYQSYNTNFQDQDVCGSKGPGPTQDPGEIATISKRASGQHECERITGKGPASQWLAVDSQVPTRPLCSGNRILSSRLQLKVLRSVLARSLWCVAASFMFHQVCVINRKFSL